MSKDLGCVPNVIVDDTLTKTYRSVDFGFTDHQEYLRKKGVSDEDIASLNVEFVPELHDRDMGKIDGNYSSADRFIRINLRQGFSGKPTSHINSTLAHESEHSILDVTSQLTEEDIDTNQKYRGLYSQARGASWLRARVLRARARSVYRKSAEEKKARKAGKLGPDIVSLELAKKYKMAKALKQVAATAMTMTVAIFANPIVYVARNISRDPQPTTAQAVLIEDENYLDEQPQHPHKSPKNGPDNREETFYCVDNHTNKKTVVSPDTTCPRGSHSLEVGHKAATN